LPPKRIWKIKLESLKQLWKSCVIWCVQKDIERNINGSTSKEKVFITGITGFTGKHLKESFEKGGFPLYGTTFSKFEALKKSPYLWYL